MIDGGDRRSAIGLALELAHPGDVVAILGKGHETGQEIAGQVLPFSDPEVVLEQWAVRGVCSMIPLTVAELAGILGGRLDRGGRRRR